MESESGIDSGGSKSPESRSPLHHESLPEPNEKANKSQENSESEPSTPIDWILPPKRHLGYLESLTKPPVPNSKCTEPIDFHLRKVVGLVVNLTKQNPHFTEEFIDQLSNLAVEYFSSIVASLHKLTEVQRHSKPGITDLELCLDQYHVTPSDLHLEYERCKLIPKRLIKSRNTIHSQIKQCLDDFYSESYELAKDDPSSVFHSNEQYEIAALVPHQRKRPDYIPSYLPSLPPDYTYQNTGSYMKTYTELKQIKLKLVEESRLNEKSLYKLINDGRDVLSGDLESKLAVPGSSDVESEKEDIMSTSGDNQASDAETPQDIHKEITGKDDSHEESNEGLESSAEIKAEDETNKKPDEDQLATTDSNQQLTFRSKTPHSDKHFDFVAYAQKRHLAKDRQAEHLAKKRHLREKNIIMRAEKLFSPYAELAPSKNDQAYYSEYLLDVYKNVIRTTRLAEKKKTARLVSLLEEKKKREIEQKGNNESFEFGFSFNPNGNVLEDSEEEEEQNDFAELDFGDGPKQDEHSAHAGKRPAKAPQSEPVKDAEGGESDIDNDELEDAEKELQEVIGAQEQSSEHANLNGAEAIGHDKEQAAIDREFESIAGEQAEQTTAGQPPLSNIGLNDGGGDDVDDDSLEDELIDT